MDMRPATSSTPAPPTSSHASPSVSSEQGVALSGERRLLGLLRPDPEGHSDMDSDDSVWEPVSEGSSAESSTEEVQDGLSDEESLDEFAEDRSINWCGEDFHDKVVGLIQRDKCDDRCLQGKAAELENFLRSTSNMTAQEKKQSVLTSLAMLMKTDTAVRRRGTGERHVFTYYLPLIGRVCRETWCAVYDVSTATITRYRRQIQRGTFSVKVHKGLLNMNATKIEIRWLVSWFRSFASILGDVVPVRVRTQKTIDGNVRKQYTDENYTLLPAYFTWDQLYTEMNAYVLENDLDVREPRPSTFRKLLQQYCPTIRIRSPRSNVCDLCAILHTRMRSCITAELTEELGVHTEAAKEMRLEYKKDLASVSEDHAVIVMDFSQNLTFPSVASTPSQWYFLSLVNVHVFGIYYANKGIQYNYVYEESVAGKGTDEVNSMLYHFIQRIVLANGHRKLTIYADNCGGQNKNNFVVKMLLALAQTGELDVVELKFFVKGHTKNAVDRGFGLMRKKIAKEDVWTADQLLEVINNSSSSSALVHIPKENTMMKLFRTPVTEAYKDLKGVQRYQIFTMSEKKPGVVSCRVGPANHPVDQDLRRSFDGIQTNAAKVRSLLAAHLEPLQPPPPNFEKKQQMYNKVRPYAPSEFGSDPLYAAPTDDEERHAKEAKQARRSASAKKKKIDAAVCDEAKVAPVDCEEENEDHAKVSKATSAQPKTGTRSRKRAKKDN